MHLVIATRVDPPLPLARLRARGQMIELRTADLRFTPEEVALFFNQVMDLGLSTEDIDALEARTEGWIVGLQLAALSLQEKENASEFIQTFTGSHHHILDYLVEEVLYQQSQDTQSFLLQTSILDRLTGSLCDAVYAGGTGQINGQETLERLTKSNLFIVPLDGERRWYRYHHLFAELLQARLKRHHPELLDTLHLRAVDWLVKNGQVDEAIDHAFSARDFDRAATLIEQIASRTMNLGRVTTILRWLDALPKRMLDARPRLSFYRAWAMSMAGEPRAAEKILLDAKSALARYSSTAENLALRGELSAILAGILTYRNDPPRVIREAEEALSFLPKENLLSRARANISLGIAYAYSDEIQKAIKTYQQTRDLALKAENPFLSTVAIALVADIQIHHQGRLKEAAQNLKSALALGKKDDGSYYAFTGLAHSLLGEINLEWNNIEAATRYLETGLKLVQRAGIGHSLIHSYCAAARLKIALDEIDLSIEALRSADQAVQANPLVQFQIHNLACQTKLALHLGDTEAAMRWAKGHRCELPESLPVHLHEFQQISLARVYLAQGGLKEAIDTLSLIQSQAESADRRAHLIEIYLLKALVYKASGQSNAAIEFLDAAITLAAPEGFIQTFIEHGEPMMSLLREADRLGISSNYVKKLLSAFTLQCQPDSVLHPVKIEEPLQAIGNLSTASPLMEPLTERELEVLCLMAEGLTYNEIADQIMVSLNTVRTHVKNLYSKLFVHKRSQAIAKARELKLL
jgi:LuxR family maltose regulon positive regulatory protein